MTDLRIIGNRLRGCSECHSHEIIMLSTHRDGVDDSTIVCMRCGHTVRSEHAWVAARIWGMVGVHS